MVLRLALLVALLAPAAFAQEAERDTVFEAHLRAAWSAARDYEGENRDSLWRALAVEPFAYYREHPDTPTGHRAADAAFMMWGNTDAADEARAATEHVPTDSDLWARIIHSVENAHARADRNDQYLSLLEAWEETLTHPKARTAVLDRLGSQALSEGRDADARPYFERIVALDADSFRVASAGKSIYEIDRLGIGMEAPDFDAVTLDGDTLRLSDLRGKVVLLDFWATWCGPCLPELSHLAEAGAAEDVVIVGISLDREREALVEMVAARDLDWPHVWQEGEWQGEVARLYAIQSLPTTFLLDRQGRIVEKNLRGEAIEERIGALVGAP